MANGPTHPSEQPNKRRGNSETLDVKANRAAIIGPFEQAKRGPRPDSSGPIGPHEQAAVTIEGEIADPQPPPPPVKSRRRNGPGPQTDAAGQTRLRFRVSLDARLAKETEFSVCVFSPGTNHGPVVIESIHITVYRKRESIFDDDLATRKDAKVNPGTKKCFPFSDAQKKALGGLVKSKTFAQVKAVYTAPAKTEVKFSIEDPNFKK